MPTNPHNRKALIIGAGIGGLATAIALRQRGWQVKIFEGVAELREVGAGLSLWANALHALDHLGLGDAVRAKALPETTGGIRTANGKLLMQTSNAQLKAQFGDLSVMLHRTELHDLLRGALDQEIYLGHECHKVEETGQMVYASFSNGKEAVGDILIGADGLHSQVRAHLHGKESPVYAGYTAWRAVVHFAVEQVLAGESWGKGARFGQIPMAGGRVYWFATANAPAGQRSAEGEKAALLRTFGDWHQPIRALIEATPEAHILRNDIYDRNPRKTWGRGRITLLGDAAHPMTPNLGQGACQALEDAVVLGQCLGRHADCVAALRAYEAVRIPRTSGIVLQSRRAGWVGQWQNPLAVAVRSFLAANVLARFQVQQLAPLIGYKIG